MIDGGVLITMPTIEIAEELGKAERHAKLLRDELDGRLCQLHRDGASVAGLARLTGLSRETIYKSIRRAGRRTAT